MPFAGITGSLPTEVGLLSNLKLLHVQFNSLTGAIPTELGLTSMTNLALHYNEMEGTIPTEVGALSGLHTLGLVSSSSVAPRPSSKCFRSQYLCSLITGIQQVHWRAAIRHRQAI